MAELTKEDKSIFLEAKIDSLLKYLDRRDKMISLLSGAFLLVNCIYLYWIFTTTNTDAVLFYLAAGSVINLFLWGNISSCLQSYQKTLDEVILFEHTYSPIKPHYCLQKLEEEFGDSDHRVFFKNGAFVMILLYALGTVLFANYNGYSLLSVISLGALS